jgi:hypothetical protein
MRKSTKIRDTGRKAQEPKNITSIFVLRFVVLSLLAAGCGERQQHPAAEPILANNINRLRVMETAEDVLVKMHFTIDKAIVEAGYIRTKPLSGAQFFEFWRSDNVGKDNRLASNLHSIRRTAEVNIGEKGEDLTIRCRVKMQRLSLPEREVSSGARAYNLFSMSNRALQTLQLHPEQKADMSWTDLGGDEQLAAEILRRIELRIESEKDREKKT